MHAGSSALGVGGFKLYMSDNSDSNNSAKFEGFNYICSKIPYSPLRPLSCWSCADKETPNASTGGIRTVFRIPTPIPIQKQLQICDRRDRYLKRINASAAGVAHSGQAYDLPSSKDVSEVEYATEWYSESLGRPSLSPATQAKKRYRYQVEANMAEMSS